MQQTPFGARAILCHHRRAGKDHTAINWTAVASQMRVGLYIHVFPYGNQGRRVVWNGIDKAGKKFLSAFPEELIESKSDLEMRLKLKNGSVYQVLGADDPDKLVGINCIGAVFSEYALMDPQAFDLVRPILNENGGWAIFPSTPRGKNHYYDLIYGKDGSPGALNNPKWCVSIETVETTGAVDPDVIEEDRRMGVEETLIQQEYFCSFDAALQGSYYEKAMSHLVETKRIGDVPHDPALEVHTAWDLGIDDSMTIWCFQLNRAEPQLIHYIEGTGEGLPHYIKELRKLQEKSDWIYGTHFAPHDIQARELTTGETRLHTARELGIRFTVVPKDPSIEDGIESVRQLLPRCRFDSKNCYRGIEALKSYRKQWDEKLKVYRSKPLHDWASHGADAFRTLAGGLRARNPNRNDRGTLPSHADTTDYSPC
jgi:phage terminase large subunit